MFFFVFCRFTLHLLLNPPSPWSMLRPYLFFQANIMLFFRPQPLSVPWDEQRHDLAPNTSSGVSSMVSCIFFFFYPFTHQCVCRHNPVGNPPRRWQPPRRRHDEHHAASLQHKPLCNDTPLPTATQCVSTATAAAAVHRAVRRRWRCGPAPQQQHDTKNQPDGNLQSVAQGAAAASAFMPCTTAFHYSANAITSKIGLSTSVQILPVLLLVEAGTPAALPHIQTTCCKHDRHLACFGCGSDSRSPHIRHYTNRRFNTRVSTQRGGVIILHFISPHRSLHATTPYSLHFIHRLDSRCRCVLTTHLVHLHFTPPSLLTLGSVILPSVFAASLSYHAHLVLSRLFSAFFICYPSIYSFITTSHHDSQTPHLTSTRQAGSHRWCRVDAVSDQTVLQLNAKPPYWTFIHLTCRQRQGLGSTTAQ